MKGIIKIIAEDACRVVHPLLCDAGPRAAGARILRWLKANQASMETLRAQAAKVRSYKGAEFRKTYRDAAEPFIDSGVGILPIILYTPAPLMLVDAFEMAEEDPEHCIIYEIDLDSGSFATYRNATIHEVPPNCWTINKKVNFLKGNAKPLFADAVSFRLSDLPTVDRYIEFWPSNSLMGRSRSNISEICEAFPAFFSIDEVVFQLKEAFDNGSELSGGILADAASWLQRLDAITNYCMSEKKIKS